MIIVPGIPPLQETRHSRELNRRVDQVVRDYQREHPDMTEAEVRTALMKSAPGGVPPEAERRRKIVAAAFMAAVIGAFTAVASAGGTFDGPLWVTIVVILAAVAGIAIAAIRLARRD